jgi:hypothetical protein
VKKLTSPILALAAFVVVLAGCGSSGSGGGSGSSLSAEPTGGGGVNGISVGNCLNDEENFLVQPSQTVLDGQSPAGVSFTLTFYKTNAAAAAAFAKKKPKTTSLVENGVIDFKGNPSIYAGAPPAKISKSELSAIKRCIDSNKAAGN